MGRTHRPELTVGPKQLVFLTMIAVLAAVVAFLCGVQVGRGLPAAGVGAGWTAAVPAAAAAGLDVAGTGNEPGGASAPRLDGLSYFERLRGVGPPPETLDFGAPSRPAGAGEPDRPDPPAGAPAGTFVVQVMSVRGAGAARDVAAALEAKGYPVVVDPMAGIPGSLHRVRVGPFADRLEAERVSRRLRTEERFEPWVTQP